MTRTIRRRAAGRKELEQSVERVLGTPPAPTEDEVTKSIERHTAAIPSSAFLAVALGAMGLSLVSQTAGREKWGNFIGGMGFGALY